MSTSPRSVFVEQGTRKRDSYDSKSLNVLHDIARYQYNIAYPNTAFVGDIIDDLRMRDTLNIHNILYDTKHSILVNISEFFPLEILEKILLNVDFDTSMEYCDTNEIIHSICENRNFWIDKLEYDFPDEGMRIFVDPNDQDGPLIYQRFRDARSVSAIEIRDLGYESQDIFLWNLSRNGLNISGTIDTRNEKFRISGPSVYQDPSFTNRLCSSLPKSDLINILWICHVSKTSHRVDKSSVDYILQPKYGNTQMWSLNKLKFFDAWYQNRHQISILCDIIKERLLMLGLIDMV